MHDANAFQSTQLILDMEGWWVSLTSRDIVNEVWCYVKPREWGNEVSSMFLSNFRSLHAALSGPDLSLRGPPLLVICWLFRETMCFSIRSKYSTIRSCKHWFRWQDYHYGCLVSGFSDVRPKLMVMNFKQLWHCHLSHWDDNYTDQDIMGMFFWLRSAEGILSIIIKW